MPPMGRLEGKVSQNKLNAIKIMKFDMHEKKDL